MTEPPPDAPLPAPPRARSWRRRLLFALVPLLGLLLLLELAAHVHVYLRLGHELRDHRFGGAIYEGAGDEAYNRLRPGAHGGGVEIDAQGLVGELLAPDAPEVQVVALGGSTSFFQDYLGAVRARYRALPGGRPAARFASAGTPGYTVSQSLANLRRRVAPLRPDVLVIYHGINDLIPLTIAGIDPDDDRAYRAALTSLSGRVVDHRDGLWDRSAAYTLLYNRLLGAARARRARRYTAADLASSRRFERDLAALLAEARRLGAQVVLVTLAHAPPRAGVDTPWGEEQAAAAGVDRHAEVVRAAARACGLALVDAAAAMNGRAELFSDLCHFTPAGRDRLAELVTPAVAVAIARVRAAK
ncbi:MAG: SGNH/GDSL hydrolase family protein [Planctomycetota bacterium]